MAEHSTELPSGRRLGRYVVRRRLGVGGFARVYLAWDPDLEIEVAIKVPKPQLADDPAALERFRREATTAARLRHPNVVTVLTVGRLEDDFDGAPAGAPYLVMDYLPESLSGRLAAQPILPEPVWLRVGEEVARGLAYAHAQGVVHRDVKPDNILFGHHGQAVVTDFGIARAVIDGSTPASRSIVIGTPEYFSPEQARGLPLDGRTDIYALGVTLYRTATGTLPFGGTDWYAVMRQHVEDAPPSPQAHNPSLSEAASAAILRCLAKSPEDRFQSAAELAATLASIGAGATLGSAGALVGGPTVDHTAPTRLATPFRPEPPRSPRRRVPIVIAGVAVIAGGAVAAAWAAGRARVPTPAVLPATPAPAPAPTTPAESAAAVATSPAAPPNAAAVPAAPTRASLTVTVPATAAVVVNGRGVGSGTWRGESLPPGHYEIQAAVPAASGCASATATIALDLAAGQQRTLRLHPVACGALALNVTPVPAHYRLMSDAGSVVSEGTLPLSQPLVVPEGDYRLVVERAACGTYDDHVKISAASGARAQRITLFCADKP